MAAFGKIDEFNADDEDWTQYTERLAQYFIANEIEDAGKQRAILLSVCGSRTYGLMRSLVSPDKPSDRTFKQLCELIQEHHHPKPSPIAQRFKFNSEFRKSGQSISNFIADLRHLAEHCEFGATLEEMLRDRLLCGVQDDRIQRRLLSEKDLTFAKAMDIAQGMEIAAKHASDIQTLKVSQPNFLQGKEEEKVNQVQHQNNHRKFNANKISSVKRSDLSGSCGGGQHSKESYQSSFAPCFRCSSRFHSSDECRFKDAECHSCHAKGHISKMCTQKRWNRKNTRKRTDKFRANVVQDNSAEDTDDYSVYSMFNMRAGKNRVRPLVADFCVNGKSVEMQIDTGASVSIVSMTTYTHVFCESPAMKKSTAQLRTYTGENINVAGTVDVEVEYKNQKSKVQLVVEGNGPDLVGRDWLNIFRLNWTEIWHVSDTPSHVPIIERYPGVFRDGIGKVKNMTAKIHVDPTAQPKFFKPRPVPYAMRSKVNAELDRLQQEGIIEPVEFSDWAAPIVPVLKSDGRIRICGDYKVTVNQVAKLDTYPIPRIQDLYANLSGGKTFTKIDLSSAYLQLPLDEQRSQRSIPP